MSRRLFIALLFLLSCAAAVARAAEAPIPAKVEFNRDVRPILANTCFLCHGPDKASRKAKMRLDIRDEAIKPAKSGAIPIVPGKPEQSEFVRRVFATDDDDLMPPPKAHKPLTARQKQVLKRWIEQGAQYQQHWSYEKPVRATVPAGENGVDFLIEKRLSEIGLEKSPIAPRRVIIRRLYFDLLGLPPTPQEVDSFVKDPAPDAYEILVDRLLANPHYGERMAIGWLDVVRFADTIGYHSDNPRNTWPYRDWVIQSFNDNKQFDRFTVEQIAGDLLPDASQETRVGSAFNRLLLSTEEGGAQPKDYEARMLTDRVRAIGTAFLGQTTGCAQCHDHKFDPFTQRDFYSLGAFFADIDERSVGKREEGMIVVTPEASAHLAQLTAKAKAPSGSDPKAYAKAERERKAFSDSLPHCLVSMSAPQKRTVRIFPRGNWMDESGEIVKAALPHYLPQPPATDRELTRLDLARWLVSRDNPLTARVFVNRLWKQCFGIGLSKNLDDLGTQGEWPVNPELLDWLACEFMDPSTSSGQAASTSSGQAASTSSGQAASTSSGPAALARSGQGGWDIKHVIRVIVTSHAYMQTSTATAEQLARDPYNRQNARQGRFRLDAELVRDNALAISGLLAPQIGGPSVKPYQPDGYWENLNFPTRKYVADSGENQYRRGIYIWWQRSFLHPSLLAFDAPSREECTAERSRSNIPQQALALLNDPTYVEASRALAARILNECHGNVEQRIAWAWQQALQRDPTADESQIAKTLFDQHLAAYRSDASAADALLKTGLAPVPAGLDHAELAAWTHVARVLMNLHETITRE